MLRNIDLTEAEWTLMEQLWGAPGQTGRALTDALHAKTSWARSTTLTLLRRLTEKGHRRIGLLVLNSPMNIGADRLAGCLRALREVGVEQDPALVRCCAAAAVDGYTQTRLMMTMPDPPTAIVCCSEELCTGAVRACMDLSLAPGRDISLVSFDELITPLAPTAITSVFSPRRKMAKVAAERLLEMVANPANRTPRKDVVETIIHEQHSIAQL